MYRYMELAQRFIESQPSTYKKYFYVLRPRLACKWILAEGTPPPMLFKALMDKHLDDSIKPDVEKLLEMKMTMPEIGEGKRFDKVNEYLDKTIEEVEQIIAELPDKDTQGWEKLNKVFLKLI